MSHFRFFPDWSLGKSSGECYTLILPSLVSIGNVGQLAVDLLISSLKPEKLCKLHHDAIIPLVGSDPMDLESTDLMTAAEIYKKDNYLFLQLRSDIVKGQKKRFIDDLVEWIQSLDVEIDLICLSSSEAHERLDSQINFGNNLRYLSTFEEDDPELKSLGWNVMEKRDCSRHSINNSEKNDELFIPGGGFSKDLLIKARETGVKCRILMTFASEGDNAPDAYRLVEYYNQWKNQIEFKDTPMGKRMDITVPPSWSHLFGNSALSFMY